MLGKLPSHLQDQLQFSNTKGIILSTLIPSYFRDLSIQNLLQQQEYLHLLRKIKALNTHSRYPPKMILKHLIAQDNLRFYHQIKKYFQTVFKNETHLLNLICHTIKEYDLVFLPKKILNYLFQETDFFLNLPYFKVVNWFSNSLYLNEFQIAYQFISLYPQFKIKLFQHIFKGLLRNLNGIQIWESLNPKSTSEAKWNTIDSETHFKHFWESNFPGGIGIYLVKSKNYQHYSNNYHQFYPSNFEYYRQYHWIIKNNQQRKAVSKKLDTLAYLLKHDHDFILDETGILKGKVQKARRPWGQLINPFQKFENDMKDLFIYYSNLSEYILRNITPLNHGKKPLSRSIILATLKTIINEINQDREPYLKKNEEDRCWKYDNEESYAKFKQFGNKVEGFKKILTDYKKMISDSC